MGEIPVRYPFLLTLLIAGCASTPAPEPQAGSWANQCYVDFERDVSEIAGQSATDCGFLPFRATARDRAATETCAKDAVKSGKPFKFGYGSFGDDSAFCDVAIRRPDGQLVAFFFDSDVTGQMGTNGNHSTVWTSKCSKVEFKPGTIGPGSFFAMQDCTEAPEIFSGLSSRK